MRLALVGCGKHTQATIAKHLLRLRDMADVSVCVDVDAKAAERVCQITSAQHAATNIEQVNLQQIDAALLALPPLASYEIATNLLRNGIPCFIEKPVAHSSAAIADLMKIAEERRTFVQVGFNFRFAAAVSKLRTCLAQLGNVPVSLAFEFRSKHPTGSEWGIDDPVEAWLRNNGIHILDLANVLGGRVIRIAVELFRHESGRFVMGLLLLHETHSHSLLRLGNLTDRFDLKMDLLSVNMAQLFMPHLGKLILKTSQAEEMLYRTPNLDDGFSRAGYGPELSTFLEGVSKGSHEEAPGLSDALYASQLCDTVLGRLDRAQFRVGT